MTGLPCCGGRFRLGALFLLIGGCVGLSSEERLKTAIYDYNNAVRWGNVRQATPFLKRDRQAAFVSARRRERNELELNDYEIVEVEVSEGGQRADVRVTYTWHRRSQGLMRQTEASQQWQRKGRDWLLVDEKRTAGEALAWLP